MPAFIKIPDWAQTPFQVDFVLFERKGNFGGGLMRHELEALGDEHRDERCDK